MVVSRAASKAETRAADIKLILYSQFAFGYLMSPTVTKIQ